MMSPVMSPVIVGGDAGEGAPNERALGCAPFTPFPDPSSPSPAQHPLSAPYPTGPHTPRCRRWSARCLSSSCGRGWSPLTRASSTPESEHATLMCVTRSHLHTSPPLCLTAICRPGRRLRRRAWRPRNALHPPRPTARNPRPLRPPTLPGCRPAGTGPRRASPSTGAAARSACWGRRRSASLTSLHHRCCRAAWTATRRRCRCCARSRGARRGRSPRCCGTMRAGGGCWRRARTSFGTPFFPTSRWEVHTTRVRTQPWHTHGIWSCLSRACFAASTAGGPVSSPFLCSSSRRPLCAAASLSSWRRAWGRARPRAFRS